MNFAEIPLSAELGDSLRQVFGLPAQARLETLGDLVTAFGRETPRPRVEDLTSDRPTRHEVRVDGRTLHTHCFLDALMLPFVLPSNGRIEVRSVSPRSGAEVTAVVTEHDVEASPADAVVSFGSLLAAEGPVQSSLCPYLNAFASRDEYERWANDTPEAVTIPLPLQDAFALAREWATVGEASTPDGGSGCRC